MKFFKRAGLFKASNVTFNPTTISAHSYGWWEFVRKINGAVVFNEYRYSNSTSKHQSKVRRLMHKLGIKIDLFVRTSCDLSGRQRGAYPEKSRIGRMALEEAYRSMDFERAEQIKRVFKVNMTRAEVDALYVDMEEQACDAFLMRSVRRQEDREIKAFRAAQRTLETYLENEVCFRDYQIFHKNAFGDAEGRAARIVAVHQCVDVETLEQDVQNALHAFQRDGFSEIVFYVGGAQ